jgi:CheY-like chemotaxis protein
VLLVEDNKINQKLGVKMLKTLGYNAIVADDGQDGIEKLVENDRDIALILMDQSMPRMDGITATRKIREMEHSGALTGKRRPIIMVTAVVGPDAQAMCMSAGTDAFLPKPLALTKLDNTLKKFMG